MTGRGAAAHADYATGEKLKKFLPAAPFGFQYLYFNFII